MAVGSTTFLLGDHSELEPPDPIPNSEVKRFSADGSVGFPHVRVGHRQAPITKKGLSDRMALFLRLNFANESIWSYGDPVHLESFYQRLMTKALVVRLA